VPWTSRIRGWAAARLPAGLAGRLALAVLLVEVAVLLRAVRHGFSRPFWYDEQQRAFQLALPPGRIWAELADAESPLPLGWIVVERAFTATFGQVEWALRLPVIASVAILAVAAYLLARRLVGVGAALLTTGALLANGSLSLYTPQIKQYPTEMALSVVALLLWMQAGDKGRASVAQAVRYLGILLCLLTSTATTFVAGPLLALDLLRAVRDRQHLRRAVMALVTGLVALAHLVLFIMPQSKVANAGSDWEFTFMPTVSIGAAADFVVRQSLSFVPEIVTQPFGIDSGRQALAITVLLVVGLAAGAVVAVVDRRARPLLVALGGALLLQLVASAGRRWSFGFVRVNLFLVPLLYLIAGIGLARTLALLARLTVGRAEHRPSMPRRALAGAGALVLAATIATGGWAGTAASATQIGRSTVAAREPGWVVQQTGWGDGLRYFVERTRERAEPGDVVVLIRRMGFKGWAYYMWSYTGWQPQLTTRPPVDERRTLMMNQVDQAQLRSFLAEHRAARRVFVLIMTSAAPGSAKAVEGPLRETGRVPVDSWQISYTGRLTMWAVEPEPEPPG
jgi:4-amino-4-deoxy-L-arabinose transferase-like glycosyltransferase